MLKKNKEIKETSKEKIIDIDAGLEGNLFFKDAVNLRINGSFEGKLDTKGKLIIDRDAIVTADIEGDTIIIAGKVKGNISARIRLEIIGSAQLLGNIKTPILKMEQGALLRGRCDMVKPQKNYEKGTKEK